MVEMIPMRSAALLLLLLVSPLHGFSLLIETPRLPRRDRRSASPAANTLGGRSMSTTFLSLSSSQSQPQSSSSASESTTTTTSAAAAAAAAASATTTAATTAPVPILVEGRNIEVTPSLEEYVYKRIGTILSKLRSNGSVRDCDVILSVSKNPKVKNGHCVEIVTSVTGTSIVCQHKSADMYTSIDAAANNLKRKLRQYKERRTAGWHGGGGGGGSSSSSSSRSEQQQQQALQAALLEALDDDVLADSTTFATTKKRGTSDTTASAAATNFINGENYNVNDDNNEFVDPEAKRITKMNNFDLNKPISVDEAVFALDYVDHDFYVFKNEATDKITVVYKRHVGGIGLIEP